MLIIVCGFFMLVCLAFPILSLLFIPQWQTALAHLRAAFLGNIALHLICIPILLVENVAFTVCQD